MKKILLILSLLTFPIACESQDFCEPTCNIKYTDDYCAYLKRKLKGDESYEWDSSVHGNKYTDSYAEENGIWQETDNVDDGWGVTPTNTHTECYSSGVCKEYISPKFFCHNREVTYEVAKRVAKRNSEDLYILCNEDGKSEVSLINPFVIDVEKKLRVRWEKKSKNIRLYLDGELILDKYTNNEKDISVNISPYIMSSN